MCIVSEPAPCGTKHRGASESDMLQIGDTFGRNSSESYHLVGDHT